MDGGGGPRSGGKGGDEGEEKGGDLRMGFVLGRGNRKGLPEGAPPAMPGRQR